MTVFSIAQWGICWRSCPLLCECERWGCTSGQWDAHVRPVVCWVWSNPCACGMVGRGHFSAGSGTVWCLFSPAVAKQKSSCTYFSSIFILRLWGATPPLKTQKQRIKEKPNGLLFCVGWCLLCWTLMVLISTVCLSFMSKLSQRVHKLSFNHLES